MILSCGSKKKRGRNDGEEEERVKVKNGKRTAWTKEEDKKLKWLKEKDVTWEEIA
jgi:hypothetical protein